jgi:hypothetical protein
MSFNVGCYVGLLERSMVRRGGMNALQHNNSLNRSADWMAFIIIISDLIECFMPRPVNSSVGPLRIKTEDELSGSEWEVYCEN